MKQHSGWKSLTAGLAALVLAFGAGLPCVQAEDWPAETVNDAEGRIYKQVHTPDGGVEVWQFIGVFGSPDEALELVGLSEDSGKKGKETIGEIPCEYDLKKITGKTEQDGGQALKDGESVQIGVRNGENARIFIKAEDDLTYIIGPESVLRGPKIDDPVLFGAPPGSPEQAGAAEAAYESETGPAATLSPGESLELRFSKREGAAVKIKISRSGTETSVLPVTIRKAGKITFKWKIRKPETVSKPEIGTLKEKPETVTVEEENPDAETGAAAEGSPQKPKNTGRHRPGTIQKTIPVDIINWGFNQIFIQENRASGR